MFNLVFSEGDPDPSQPDQGPGEGNPDAEVEQGPAEETGEVSGVAEYLVKYSEIRDRIEDADVFLFRGTHLISRLFQAGSHSRYSHSGLVGWWHRRLMLFQAELTAVQAVPLGPAVRGYKGLVDWYKVRPEHRSRVDPQAVLDEARSNLGLAYATTDIFRTVLHEVADLELPADCEDPHALFCSQYVARCFRIAGLPLKDELDMAIFPSEIAMSPVLMYMGTIVPDLTETEARRNLDR